MNRSIILVLLGVLMLTLVIVVPVVANASSLSDPKASDVHVTLEWAAFTASHAAVNYVVEGRFETPAGYLPIKCPVSKAQLYDAKGKDITGAVVTSCRHEGENQYSVAQYFYNDFQSSAPETLEVTIGDITLMPVGNGEVRHFPLVGAYSFAGQFKRGAEITVYPRQQVEQHGVSLAVNRVDFTPSTIKVDACIVLPDRRDWVPDAYLSVAGRRIPVDEWFIPNFREDPKVFERCERCYTFLAYTDIPDFRQKDEGTIAFGVAEVYTNVPECVDAQGLDKIKYELEKHGFQPELDQSGYYCFMRDIFASALGEEDKASLVEYIVTTLPEHVVGPFEVEIH